MADDFQSFWPPGRVGLQIYLQICKHSKGVGQGVGQVVQGFLSFPVITKSSKIFKVHAQPPWFGLIISGHSHHIFVSQTQTYPQLLFSTL